MDSEPNQDMGRHIVRYASDPATAGQLRKLPAFAVSDDTASVFGHLLEMLHRTTSSSPSPFESGASMRASQSPHIKRV